jgi:hypothetical protein
VVEEEVKGKIERREESFVPIKKRGAASIFVLPVSNDQRLQSNNLTVLLPTFVYSG